MLRLLVKGNKAIAADAAAYRGVPFVFRSEHTECEWVMGETGDEHYNAVMAWFCEPIEAVKGKGFPDGSLLLYSFADNGGSDNA